MVALGLCALSFAGLLWLPGRSWARLPAALAPMLVLLAMRLGSWGQLPFAASLLLCLVLLALLLAVALLPVGRGHAGGPEAGATSFDALSAREAEVLRLLLTGMTQAEAAECLGIKASTVGTYCRRALDKLGAGSLGEVAATLPPQARSIEGPSMSAPVAGGACIVLVAVSALGWTGWRLSGIATLMAICCVACALGLRVRRPAKGVGSIALASGAGLSLGIVLRAVALAQLPAWTCVVVSGLVVGAVAWRAHGEGLPSISLAIDDALAAFAVAAMLGLATGPVSSDAGNLLVAGHLFFDWRMVLVVAVPACALLLSVAAGDALLGPCEVARVHDCERCVYLLRARGLPDLEARALVLIAQGKDSATIARELNVARGTVSSYRMRGYRALGIRSRAELTALLVSGISS